MVEGEDGLRGVLSQLMTSTHLNHLPNEAVLMVWSAQSPFCAICLDEGMGPTIGQGFGVPNRHP